VTPLPAAATTPAPKETAPSKVAVELNANVPNARVTFRRRVRCRPRARPMQITPSDIVELVEISAPGYKTVRYWLTFDRPTTLNAKLVRGNGSRRGLGGATLVALARSRRRASRRSRSPRRRRAVAMAKVEPKVEPTTIAAKAEPDQGGADPSVAPTAEVRTVAKAAPELKAELRPAVARDPDAGEDDAGDRSPGGRRRRCPRRARSAVEPIRSPRVAATTMPEIEPVTPGEAGSDAAGPPRSPS